MKRRFQPILVVGLALSLGFHAIVAAHLFAVPQAAGVAGIATTGILVSLAAAGAAPGGPAGGAIAADAPPNKKPQEPEALPEPVEAEDIDSDVETVAPAAVEPLPEPEAVVEAEMPPAAELSPEAAKVTVTPDAKVPSEAMTKRDVVTLPVAPTSAELEIPAETEASEAVEQAVDRPPRPRTKPRTALQITRHEPAPKRKEMIEQVPEQTKEQTASRSDPSPATALQPTVQESNTPAEAQPGQFGAGGRGAHDGKAQAATGGAPGTDMDYYAALQAWLEKHKRYPRRAKLRRQQGVVLLRFVVSRSGGVSSFAIAESSGHALLDDEARKLLERAQPLPVMPRDMRVAQVELVVPIRFTLR